MRLFRNGVADPRLEFDWPERNGVRASSEIFIRGQIWASNEDLEHLISALTHTKHLQINNPEGMPLLTRREEEVVHLVADGLKNREIAQQLKVKEHSIRNYIYRIFEKLGVSSRVELILYVFSHRESGK